MGSTIPKRFCRRTPNLDLTFQPCFVYLSQHHVNEVREKPTIVREKIAFNAMKSCGSAIRLFLTLLVL